VKRSIVCIGEYGTTSEAALAQNLLQENDIESFLAGENTQGWAFGMGPWTQGVRLEVRAEDAERATALVSAVEGRIRERVEREYGSQATATAEPAPGETSVSAPELSADGDDVPPESLGDAGARRAAVSAVFSLVLPPLLLYAIILVVLSHGATRATTLTPRGRRWRLQALLVIVLVTLLFASALLYTDWVAPLFS
jgi:hypothetical protein